MISSLETHTLIKNTNMHGSKKHPANMLIHATMVEQPKIGTIKIRGNSMI